MDREAALEKIRKCLALSSSPNENEARTALLMARRLMAEYKIGSADGELDGGQVPEERHTSVTFTTIRDNWIIDLVNLMGPRFCCRPFSSREYGKKTRTASFVGFPQDLDVCVPAFEFAVTTIRGNIIRGKMDRERAYSYAKGFIQGLEEEYSRQDAEVLSETVSERSLVTVMDIPDEVERYSRERFRSETVRIRSYSVNEGAFSSGYNDGRNHLKKRVRDAPVKKLKG